MYIKTVERGKFPNTNTKIQTIHFPGTGTSMKSVRVTLVSWARTHPLK